MIRIDLNCDLAELENGNDLAIMPFISSCNIACGGHAGSFQLMERAVEEADKNKVTIGAHPGYQDKENFGRISIPMTRDKIQQLVIEQLSDLNAIVSKYGSKIDYVKLHGALYHDTAHESEKADAVFLAIKAINPDLAVLGMRGTFHERANVNGLKFYAESFADRRYNENGELVSRMLPGAVLEKEDEVIDQVMDIVNQFVKTNNGKKIDLMTDSICLHGDHKNSLSIARAIKKVLSQNDIAVQSFLE